MAERLVHDSSNPSGPSSSSFFSSVDDPEPLELIRINLEASLMALAGKLQALMKLYRGSNNNGRLQQLGPGLNALLEKYEEGVYGNKAESTVDSGKSESSNTTETDEQTKSRLSSPTMKKKLTSKKENKHSVPNKNRLTRSVAHVVLGLDQCHLLLAARQPEFQSTPLNVNGQISGRVPTFNNLLLNSLNLS